MGKLGDLFRGALDQAILKSGTDQLDEFVRQLDMLYRNVSQVATLTRGNELPGTLIVRDRISSTLFNASTGWQIDGAGNATFRNVAITGGSLLISSAGKDRISLQADGDGFFGSDISAAATTSLSIFSNAQTYNTESMGAGDVLFGDNSANKANLLWDASAGKILFRGGATTQGYISTTGQFVAGSDKVVLDSYGLAMLIGTGGYTSAVRWPHVNAVSGTNSWTYGKMALLGWSPLAGYGDLWMVSNAGDTGCSDTAVHSELYFLTSDYVDGNRGTELLLSSTWSPSVTHAVQLKVATKTRLDMSLTETVINDGGNALDFRVEGDTDANLLTLTGSLDAIGIGGVGISGQKLSVYGNVAIRGPHPWVDVTAYGAKGDNSTNDDTAVAAAVAAVPDGGVLYFPAGNYILTAAIAFSGKSVTIRGDGPDKTNLKFTGCHGITITLTDDDNSADVRDMSLQTNTAGTYIALTVTGKDVASSTYPHLFVSNLWIHSTTDASKYWSQGIKLVEVWNGKISHCILRGSNTYTDMDAGIYITNQSIDNHIVDCHFYCMKYGVSVADVTPNPEGVHLTDCTMVAVQYGVYWSAPTNGGLDLQVLGGHINAYDYGVFCDRVPQSSVIGVLIYKDASSTSAFGGMYFKTSDNVRIADVCVQGAGTSGGGNGIILATGCDYCAIDNTSINDQTTGIWLQSGCTNSSIVGGIGVNTTTPVLDQGTTNAVVEIDAGVVRVGTGLRVGGDVAGVASHTSLTNAVNTTLTNAYVVKGGQAASTINTGWMKIYIGTNAAWVPYWTNATP